MTNFAFCDVCDTELKLVFAGKRTCASDAKVELWFCRRCDSRSEFIQMFESDIPDIRSRL